MTIEELIRMAREVGAIHIHGKPNEFAIVGNDSIKAFAALVAAAEREACASVCFQEGPSIDGELIAEAIRARGETK